MTASRARKSAKRLPGKDRRRIAELLLFLRENPVPAEYYDIIKMQGCVDTFRARIGDLRVIYEVLWKQKKVHVLVVKQRERAYT